VRHCPRFPTSQIDGSREEIEMSSYSKSDFLSYFLASIILIASSGALATPAPKIIDLKAGDGTLLKATYFASAKPGPGVLLLHQCDAQRKLWDVLAEQMAASGISVLTMDYRGFGESGGPRFDQMTGEQRGELFNKIWPADIEIAYSYLLAQPEVQHDKIGAGGASCGVNNSIQLARRHPEVKSLMLLSGPTNRDGRLFLTSSKLPIFTAVANDDKYPGSVEEMQWLFAVSPNPASRFARFADGGHGAVMFGTHPELASVIAKWFDATLQGHPETVPKTQGEGMDPRKFATLEQIDRPGGAAEVAALLAKTRERDPKAVLFSEVFVNQLGYEHSQLGDTKGAVEIMKLNVAAYPDSPNACDSLSDVYLADGQKDLALQTTKKALSLLEKDRTDSEERRNAIRGSAETKIRQLEQK
jgi:dienelactone hydrolase